MSQALSTSTGFADGIEIRFDRQPCEVARAGGLEFQRIDQAAIVSAVSVRVGTSYVAAIPGWAIYCNRPRPDVIRVVRLVREATESDAGDAAGRREARASIGRTGRAPDQCEGPEQLGGRGAWDVRSRFDSGGGRWREGIDDYQG